GALAAAPRAAGRVWHIHSSIGTDFYVSMNPTITLGRIKNVDARTERYSAIIAPGTLRTTGDVLRAIVNGMGVQRMWRRRWDCALIVGTTPECFVIGTLGNAASDKVLPCRPIVIGVGRVTIPGGKLQSEHAPCLMIDKADWI